MAAKTYIAISAALIMRFVLAILIQIPLYELELDLERLPLLVFVLLTTTILFLPSTLIFLKHQHALQAGNNFGLVARLLILEVPVVWFLRFLPRVQYFTVVSRKRKNAQKSHICNQAYHSLFHSVAYSRRNTCLSFYNANQ